VSATENRRIAFILGILAALLLLISAFLHFVVGVGLLVTGAGRPGLGSLGASIVEVVVALLFGFFSVLGRSPGNDRSLAAGLVLIVLAVVGWAALGFGGELLALLAAVLALVAGVLFLVSGR
jgi:hypothetical protein